MDTEKMEEEKSSFFDEAPDLIMGVGAGVGATAETGVGWLMECTTETEAEREERMFREKEEFALDVVHAVASRMRIYRGISYTHTNLIQSVIQEMKPGVSLVPRVVRGAHDQHKTLTTRLVVFNVLSSMRQALDLLFCPFQPMPLQIRNEDEFRHRMLILGTTYGVNPDGTPFIHVPAKRTNEGDPTIEEEDVKLEAIQPPNLLGTNVVPIRTCWMSEANPATFRAMRAEAKRLSKMDAMRHVGAPGSWWFAYVVARNQLVMDQRDALAAVNGDDKYLRYVRANEWFIIKVLCLLEEASSVEAGVGPREETFEQMSRPTLDRRQKHEFLSSRLEPTPQEIESVPEVERVKIDQIYQGDVLYYNNIVEQMNEAGESASASQLKTTKRKSAPTNNNTTTTTTKKRGGEGADVNVDADL